MNVLIFLVTLSPVISAFRFASEAVVARYAVVGQKYLANREDVPHHALIVYGTYFCSGSLIGSKIVLTAASCFLRRQDENVVVKIGAPSVITPGQVIPVMEIKVHEYFQYLNVRDNDIAILILKKHVKFSSQVKKVLLVEFDVSLGNDLILEVAGWGYSNLPHKYLSNLLLTEMSVMDASECKKHTDLLTSSNFCARYHVDRRLSDNGGGAIHKNLLVGILSFGGTSIHEPHLAVFTNVSYFNRWISLNINKLLHKYCKKKKKRRRIKTQI